MAFTYKESLLLNLGEVSETTEMAGLANVNIQPQKLSLFFT